MLVYDLIHVNIGLQCYANLDIRSTSMWLEFNKRYWSNILFEIIRSKFGAFSGRLNDEIPENHMVLSESES